ncbi:hypothetical protein RHMOL_Rhmol01G0195200 [Rhododendron molle]|uniref:Uncharacterized protein n=1 Tax=Rhododendron molle TaxID=49168 RepID=A0ACC0Q3J5_RHOML|nr:hypothetical protein RHMOL_Rhmol01G0195200 [Rhododendron molle]
MKRYFRNIESSSTPTSNNDPPKQSRLEVDLPDLPSDPGLRPPITNYEPNIRERVATSNFRPPLSKILAPPLVTSKNYVKRDSGLIYWDYEVGKGGCPKDGQQVFFCLFCTLTAMIPPSCTVALIVMYNLKDEFKFYPD